MQLQFYSKSENESFARVAVAAFITQLDPTLEEINDIKTVVSEAVTNSIIHGYEEKSDGLINITVKIEKNDIEIIVEDNGKGIEDIEKAIQPLFTTKPELERSGMGFTIMENMMDYMAVESGAEKGTKVILKKHITSNSNIN